MGKNSTEEMARKPVARKDDLTPARAEDFIHGASTYQAENKTPSKNKKFLLSLTDKLHSQLKSEAASRGVSLNDYIVRILEERR